MNCQNNTRFPDLKSININDIMKEDVMKNGYSCRPSDSKRNKTKISSLYSCKKMIKDFSLNKFKEFNPYQPFNIGTTMESRNSHHKLELLPPPDFISNNNGQLVEILRINHDCT